MPRCHWLKTAINERSTVGTFTFDTFANMTPEQIRERCRVLAGECMKWQQIALNLDAGGRAALTPESIDALNRLRDSYSD